MSTMAWIYFYGDKSFPENFQKSYDLAVNSI